jgi:hypothetical protein
VGLVQPTLERKADLLELTLKGAFEQDQRPSKAAIRAIADYVLRLLDGVTDDGPAALTQV